MPLTDGRAEWGVALAAIVAVAGLCAYRQNWVGLAIFLVLAVAIGHRLSRELPGRRRRAP
jgi:hypothetical protein